MKKHFLIIFLIAFVCSGNAGMVYAGGDHSSDSGQMPDNEVIEAPNEPMVTGDEADTIQTALEMYKESPYQAIEFLSSNISESSSAALDFALGTLFFRDNNLEGAAHAYEEALHKLPSFTRARSNLARIYLRQKREDLALEEFHQVLLEGARDPSTLTLIGYIHMGRDEAVPAENAYREAILLDPEDEQAYYGLAKALIAQERYDEVIRLLKQLIAENYKQSNLWSLLANAYTSLERPMDAIKTLESAANLKVASGEAMALLGDLYLNEQMTDEAVRAYERAIKSGSLSNARILRAAEGLLMIHSPQDARRLLNNSGLGNGSDLPEPERIKFLWLQGRIEHLSGNAKKAENAYLRVCEIDPLNGAALLFLGDLYQEDSKLEKALIVFEQAQQIDGFRERSLLRQAQLEVERQRYSNAVLLLEEVLVDNYKPHVARYLEQVRRLVH